MIPNEKEYPGDKFTFSVRSIVTNLSNHRWVMLPPTLISPMLSASLLIKNNTKKKRILAPVGS